MPQHLDLGHDGERVAEHYLLAQNYRILERNIRLGRDEIDIIAYDRTRQMIVFVEVKTRTITSDAYPIHRAVNFRKRRCLQRAIAKWVRSKRYEGPGRTDVLCIRGSKVEQHLVDIGSDFGLCT